MFLLHIPHMSPGGKVCQNVKMLCTIYETHPFHFEMTLFRPMMLFYQNKNREIFFILFSVLYNLQIMSFYLHHFYVKLELTQPPSPYKKGGECVKIKKNSVYKV